MVREGRVDPDVDQLWDDFHEVVNMTSRELEDWLRTGPSGEAAEELPDQAGSDTGRHVLGILGKRKVDLTREDVAVMQHVVDTVRAQRGDEPESTAGDAGWRHGLMALGHDPLKPR
jgi:hypothetical protein